MTPVNVKLSFPRIHAESEETFTLGKFAVVVPNALGLLLKVFLNSSVLNGIKLNEKYFSFTYR